MARTATAVALGLVLFAALSWIVGGLARGALVSLGETPRYAGDVGGLVALATFLLLLAYGGYRLAFGG